MNEITSIHGERENFEAYFGLSHRSLLAEIESVWESNGYYAAKMEDAEMAEYLFDEFQELDADATLSGDTIHFSWPIACPTYKDYDHKSTTKNGVVKSVVTIATPSI